MAALVETDWEDEAHALDEAERAVRSELSGGGGGGGGRSSSSGVRLRLTQCTHSHCISCTLLTDSRALCVLQVMEPIIGEYTWWLATAHTVPALPLHSVLSAH